MKDLKIAKGTRARFFHPMTFGTMEEGVVQKVINENTAKVRFTKPDFLGRRVFVVSTEHVSRAK